MCSQRDDDHQYNAIKPDDIALSLLVYDNRSGSTYLSALLDNFEEIGVTLESPILFQVLTGPKAYKSKAALDAALKSIYADWKFADWNIPEQALRDRLAHHIPLNKGDFLFAILHEYFMRNKPNARCWIYKNSSPYLIRKFKAAFPHAKVIFIYRDGRAVFCSKSKSFSPNAGDVMERNPVRAARIWSQYINAIDRLQYDVDILNVKYEELVTRTEDELARIYRFLFGRAPHASALDINSAGYFSKIPASQMHLHPNVGKKPVISRIDGWQTEISFCDAYLYEKTAYRTLPKMGYPLQYYRQGLSFDRRVKLIVYSMKIYFQTVHRIINRLLYTCGHPLYMWRKLMVKVEMRF